MSNYLKKIRIIDEKATYEAQWRDMQPVSVVYREITVKDLMIKILSEEVYKDRFGRYRLKNV